MTKGSKITRHPDLHLDVAIWPHPGHRSMTKAADPRPFGGDKGIRSPYLLTPLLSGFLSIKGRFRIEKGKDHAEIDFRSVFPSF